jgi:hypothetical protein
MTQVVPIGYQTFREAIGQIEDAIFAGQPDRPAVLEAREEEGDVGDGEAGQKAAAELWEAVDKGRVRPMAIGASPRKVVRLPVAMTRAIPGLRQVGSLTFLRPRNPHHSEVIGWFKVRQIPTVTLAFREGDVKKLCSNLRRRARRMAGAPIKSRNLGRPALQPVVRTRINELIDSGKWHSTRSMKALTQLVNRALRSTVSEDTVTRALDQIYAETRDRRFLRNRKSRKA